MPGLLTDALPGSPSAISQMLGLLMQHPAAGQPGQPPPPPVAPTPMPQQTAPEQPAPPQNLLGKIHDFISDRVGIKQPGGYGGLLSPEEIQQAKPGILAAGAGDSWTENLNRLLAVKGATLAAQEHGRVMQARQKMGELFPALGADATPEQRNAQLEQMYAYATQHGDLEMAKSIGDVVKEAVKVPREAQAEPPHTLVTDKGIMQWDPTTRKYVPTGMQSPDKPIPQHNIDPLSPEGIAAQLRLASAKADSKTGAPLAAPMAAKVGQAGEMIKKLSDLMPQMDALDVKLSSSAAEDVAEHGIGIGHILRVPGTKGLGSMMVNRSPEYSKYEASLSPFVLAAAHALSGARINMDQVEQIRRSVKYEPGDTPTVKAQKRKNLIDLVNSITGSLPSDAIASQEDQMDGNALASLRGYGYRGAKRGGTAAPSGKPTYEEWLKSKGKK